MKTIAIAIVTILMFVFVREGQSAYQTDQVLYETECKICDKDISEYRENSMWSIDATSATMFYNPYSTYEDVYSMRYDVNYDVCNRCKELYRKKFVETIDKVVKEFIDNAIEESAEYRKEVRYQKRDKRYKTIRDRIKTLEKDLEEWKD